MSSLRVTWDGALVGELEQTGGTYDTDYRFRYAPDATRPISVALPVRGEAYEPAETRAFFDALLPEGSLREALAARFRLPLTDSFGLLRELGADCAGALQIMEAESAAEEPAVDWLDEARLAQLMSDLPRRPLGMPEGGRVRLSLAGVQRKAVLVRDAAGRFGEPQNGMPSTHVVKPEPAGGEYPGIAVNEFFCMRLAAAVGLPVADVELVTIAGRPCLVVTRFDRDRDVVPARRLHQEDLCQAIGLAPGFKYASPDRPRPCFRDIADVLDQHGSQPGRDRLTAGRSAVFNFLVGNADAHGKNVSFLHGGGKVRLAPLYDLLSTAAWPDLDRDLAIAIGDEFDVDAITSVSFDDLAGDLGLNVAAFSRERRGFVTDLGVAARDLLEVARREGWHHPVLDATAAVIADRAPRAA